MGRMTNTSNEKERVVEENKAVFNFDKVDDNELSDEILDMVEANAPPIVQVMKEVCYKLDEISFSFFQPCRRVHFFLTTLMLTASLNLYSY
jgi:hypothetical protein